jgi:phosphoesterase RecJ-like protein
MNKSIRHDIGQAIRHAQRILVTSHIRPDGDSIGSLLGLGLALRSIGKEVSMVSADGVPAAFRHLAGSDQIVQRAARSHDLTVVVDCSDLDRTGEALQHYPKPDINIDHHITNLNFARLNLVDVKAVATAEILRDNLPGWGMVINAEVARALLTGLITDSLGFRTSNMTSKALRTAADLVDVGVNLPELYQQALISRSFEALKYWGTGLSNLERENGLVWASLTLQDRKEVNYPGRDDADLINMLSSVSDAQVAMIFVEQTGGRVKVSWRSQPGVNVSQLALQFGGGGHPSASGADIPGELEEVRQKVLEVTREFLSHNYHALQISTQPSEKNYG